MALPTDNKPEPQSVCPCSTPIEKHYLIQHRTNKSLHFVGSTCIKKFIDGGTNRKCVKCFKPNRCKTTRCAVCRVQCYLHKEYHDDNTICLRCSQCKDIFKLSKSRLCPRCDDEKIKNNKTIKPIIYETMTASEPSFIFGKYEGELIADVAKSDGKYILWLFKQKWIEPELKQELNAVMKQVVVNFGKYKNKTIAEVKLLDLDYYYWLLACG